MPSGVVYSILKKTRSTYHYMLNALKKKKQYKTKISLSNPMLRVKIIGSQFVYFAKITLIVQML